MRSSTPMRAVTDLFILPGYPFRVVDAMITNFHLPKSTLIMLVSAFAGWGNIRNAYEVAKQEHYRFYSVVDAMITNFHLPKSTLIMLVSAFAGWGNIRNAYEVAKQEHYRFYSFGDAMFIR